MAIGTNELATANLDGMDNEQLVAEIKKAKEELFNLRFQAATDSLDNHGRLKAVRRDVARIKTVIRERELGIRTEPTTVSTTDDKKSAKKTTKKEEAK
ncbi:50S ribosomal protein L29 [Actinomycetota bacterium]|nr:50S ribosomal protein L29 [Actinomycetota bacterium]